MSFAKITTVEKWLLVEDRETLRSAAGAMEKNAPAAGSTISTLLHDRINPKDCQVLSLGDTGFLQFFRVVSRDYGKPRAGSAQVLVKNKHGYGAMRLEDLKSEAQKPESQNRSLNRRKEMTRAQRNLVARVGETDHLWYALRKHGSAEQCELWLHKMSLHSTWKAKRQQEDELLRKEYLQL